MSADPDPEPVEDDPRDLDPHAKPKAPTSINLPEEIAAYARRYHQRYGFRSRSELVAYALVDFLTRTYRKNNRTEDE